MSGSLAYRTSDYLYTLNPLGRCFVTGATGDGDQAIVGLWFPNIVAVLFDREGDAILVKERQLSSYAQDLGKRHFFSDSFRGQFEQELCSWERELKLDRSPIFVKKFSVPQYGIRIDDYPASLRGIVSKPEKHSKQDLIDAWDMVRRWQDEGQFVLEWGNEYWVNNKGEIVAS